MRLILLAAVSLLMCGSASAQDKAAIQKLNDAFTSAFNKGDFATVGGMYTDDAYLLPPGRPMLHGRANVQAFWTKASDAMGDVILTTLDVKLIGRDVKPIGSEAAREIGTFALMTRGPQPQQVTGKYVVIWEKVGSDWKLATDIWNTDK